MPLKTRTIIGLVVHPVNAACEKLSLRAKCLPTVAQHPYPEVTAVSLTAHPRDSSLNLII